MFGFCRGWERLGQEVGAAVPSRARILYLVEAAQIFSQEGVHPCTFYRKNAKTDPIDAVATARVGYSDRSLARAWVGTPQLGSVRRLCRLSWKLRHEMRNHKRRIATQLEVILPGIGKVWTNRYCGSAELSHKAAICALGAKML